MIQVMPDCQEEVIAGLEKRLQELPLVSEMLRQNKTPEDILYALLGESNVKVLEKKAVAFKCDCSKAKFAGMMATLPSADIDQMIAEDHGAQAVCHFCGKKYDFTAAELRAIEEHAQNKRTKKEDDEK